MKFTYHYNSRVATAVILGAGDLGGAIARQLAAADVVSTVTLVDEAESVASGKALDIRQAGAIERSVAVVKGTGSLDAVVNAHFIVLADQAVQSIEWRDEAALGLLARVLRLNETAPIVCAGAAQETAIERAVRDFGVPRQRIFGTAPEAFRSAVAAVAALEAGCAAPDISLSVVGRPPAHIIVPWDDASIAGRRATGVLSPPALARLDARLPLLWPPGPLALASAVARAITAARSRTPRTISAFVSVTRDEGTRGRVGMLPVLLNDRGVSAVLRPALSRRDQVRLDTALA